MLSASDPVRLALEQRVQFEALIADLSAHFVNLDATMVDGAIEDALQRLGELLDVDRAALTQLADNDRTLVFTHTWSRLRGQEPPLLRVDAERVMPFGLAVLLRQEVHAISSLAELPFDSPDREFLAQRHAKSAIAVPRRRRARHRYARLCDLPGGAPRRVGSRFSSSWFLRRSSARSRR